MRTMRNCLAEIVQPMVKVNSPRGHSSDALAYDFQCWDTAHSAVQRLDQFFAEQHALGPGGEEGDSFMGKHLECCDSES